MPNHTQPVFPITSPETLMAALRQFDLNGGRTITAETSYPAISAVIADLESRMAQHGPLALNSLSEPDAEPAREDIRNIRALLAAATEILHSLADEERHLPAEDLFTIPLSQSGVSQTGWPLISAGPAGPAETPSGETHQDTMAPPESISLAAATEALADAIIQAAVAEQPSGAVDFHLRVKRITAECEGHLYSILHLPE